MIFILRETRTTVREWACCFYLPASVISGSNAIELMLIFYLYFALWPCDLIIVLFFACFCNVRLQCHRANADFLPVFAPWPCDLIIVHLFTCFCNVRLQCHRANSDFLTVSWALQCSSFHTDKDQVLSLTSLNHTLCFINSCQTYTWYITMISSSYSYKHFELVCWFSGV